MPLPVHRT